MSRNYGKDRSVYGDDFKVNHHKRNMFHKNECHSAWWRGGMTEFKYQAKRDIKSKTRTAMINGEYDLMPVISKCSIGNYWW